MLNKETKQTTEKMRGELAPLFAKAEKLGEKLRKQANETRHADQVARAWQYPDARGWAADAGEDSDTIQRTRKENAHEWHEILNNKYMLLHQAQELEQVARLNYRNYIAYICEYIAQLLHEGDTWAKYYEKKGLETLAEELRKNLGKNESLYIYRDGTSWDSFASDNFYCYLKVKIWGVCGMSASDWGTYSKHTSETQRQYKQAQEPKLYTHVQYIKLVKELKKLENEAKAKAREHHEKARASGLIYFIGGLSDPALSVWGKND